MKSRMVALIRGAASYGRAAATDTDSYVFSGMALIGAGIGWAVSIAWALVATGALLLAFGVWMITPPRPAAPSPRVGAQMQPSADRAGDRALEDATP